VDDNSPDGTGRLADAMAERDPGIHVLHRAAKDGLGRAYVAGFGWGLARPYERLAQMDADLSHDPAFLPALLDALETCEVAVGSRYVPEAARATGGGGAGCSAAAGAGTRARSSACRSAT
jgi:dolichol-phosphate mannosyltransferase